MQNRRAGPATPPRSDAAPLVRQPIRRKTWIDEVHQPGPWLVFKRNFLAGFQAQGDNSVSFDNYHFLIYEIALYFMAVMAKMKRYTIIRRFLESTYRVRGEGTQKESHPFSTFNYPVVSLEEDRNRRLKLNRMSVVGDMIVARPYPKIKKADLVQADLLGFFRSAIATDDLFGRWWPTCLVFGYSIGSLDIFDKATSPQGLKVLQAIFGINTLADFYGKVELFGKSALLKGYNERHFMNRIPFGQLLNIAEIERALGIRPTSRDA